MHVAVVNLTNGGLSGGYRKYLDQLVPRWARDARCTRLSVYLPASVERPADTAGAVIEQWPSGEPQRGFAWVRRRIAETQPDVVFIPTARKISVGGLPVVTMVRNMEPLLVPFQGNAPLECLKNVARYVSAWRACQGVARVIAVSRHVRDFLVSRWRLPDERVGVVYHGVDSVTGQTEARCPAALSDGGTRRFLFTAGSIRPARGLEDVLRALPEIRRSQPDLRLCIGGAPTSDARGYAERMRELVRTLGLGDNVVWLGHLGRSEMAWCFGHCEAFVMTSRAEACPNTLLEAMAHGSGIVSTECAPMPEFAGECALYYRPGDAAMLAACVAVEMTGDPAGRSGRRARARALVARFTWDKTAEQTIEQLILARARAGAN